MLAFMNFGQMLAIAQFYADKSIVAGAFGYIGCATMLATLILFIRYFFNDDLKARAGLAIGCLIMMVGHGIAYVGVIIGCLTSENLKASYIW